MSDKSVSRLHAEIFLKEDKLFIKDLGSNNGTYINNQEIKSSVLSNNDMVRLGKTYELMVMVGEQQIDSFREEWDLSTKLISPEDIEVEAKSEGKGELGTSTGSVLAFFQKAGKILENAFESEDIVCGILDLTFQIIPATRGFVLLVDPDTGEMVVQAQKFRSGESKQLQNGSHLSTTILDHAIKQGKAELTLS